MNTGPITNEEMIQLFGETMPMEAVDLLWNASVDKTVGELRHELREIAAKRQKAMSEARDKFVLVPGEGGIEAACEFERAYFLDGGYSGFLRAVEHRFPSLSERRETELAVIEAARGCIRGRVNLSPTEQNVADALSRLEAMKESGEKAADNKSEWPYRAGEVPPWCKP